MTTEQTERKQSPGVTAQSRARVELIKRHRAEYDEIYRAEMIRLGGKPKPTTQEKIQKLKEELAKLESELGGN
jgi:hypothetical protein